MLLRQVLKCGLANWTLEYQDDPHSCFINDANTQKNGTFSLIPRIWGGITVPDELRAITYAADKFDVPTVKVTGGQHIDPLVEQRKDLTAIWNDLNGAGMVSGHAYSKLCAGSKPALEQNLFALAPRTSLALASNWKRRCGDLGHLIN